MKLTIQVNSDQIYMRSEESIEDGGIAFTLYRDEHGDSVGFCGDESKRDMCLKIADILLGNI